MSSSIPLVTGRTEYWDAVRSRRHRLADHQQEHHQCQQDRRFQIDLLTRLDGQEEAEKGDEEDEETGRDEVNDVEETAAAHVDRESDVGVRLLAARVELLVPLSGDVVDGPFLVLGRVVDARREAGLVVEDIELVAAVRPRDEHDVTVLRVEWEILDVQCARSLDERRVQPQYQTVAFNDRVRQHEIIELLTGAVYIHPSAS